MGQARVSPAENTWYLSFLSILVCWSLLENSAEVMTLACNRAAAQRVPQAPAGVISECRARSQACGHLRSQGCDLKQNQKNYHCLVKCYMVLFRVLADSGMVRIAFTWKPQPESYLLVQEKKLGIFLLEGSPSQCLG